MHALLVIDDIILHADAKDMQARNMHAHVILQIVFCCEQTKIFKLASYVCMEIILILIISHYTRS